MDLNRLTAKAKQLIKRRGGTESLKQDAEELRDVARRPGSTTDKAKEAFEAIKEPGAPSRAREEPRQDAPPDAPPEQRA